MKKKISLLLASFLMTFATASQAIVIEGDYLYEGTDASGVVTSLNLTFSVDFDLDALSSGLNRNVAFAGGTNILGSPQLMIDVNADGTFSWYLNILEGTSAYYFSEAGASWSDGDLGSEFAFLSGGYNILDPTLPSPNEPAANVPEPSTLGLLAISLLGLGFARRRRAA